MVRRMSAQGKRARRKQRRASLVDELRQNALRAAEEVSAGLLARLRAAPDELEALRLKRAPSCSAQEFLRSAKLLAHIYQESLVLIFRLLFLLFCERRNLLPVNASETGETFLDSLRAPIASAPARGVAPTDGEPPASSLWPRLQELFRRIAEGWGEENPISRGWLFNPAQHDLLESFAPAEEHLARAFALLDRFRALLFQAQDESIHDIEDEGRRRVDEIEPDWRLLGSIYEAALELTPRVKGETGTLLLERERGSSRRKRSGSYYTPERVARYLVEKTLGPLVRGEQRGGAREDAQLSAEELLRLKALDPAMGAGCFLLAAGDYLARAYCAALLREGRSDSATESSANIAACRRKVAEHCLYGADIDPLAVELARLSLHLFTMERGQPLARFDDHLKCGDALAGMLADSFDWRAEFPEVFAGEREGSADGAGEKGGFDAVIGNPPYLSFSGRQKAKGYLLPASGVMKESGRVWRSSHGLFMVGATQLLKAGGFAAMIVPDQVGHLSGYGATRAAVLAQARLIEVRYWGEDVFAGVSTPALTFIVRREENARARQQGSPARVVRRDASVALFFPRGTDEWYISPQHRAYEEMRAAHEPLLTFFDSGAHTGNVASKLILREPAEGALPVLAGRQVRAFHCAAPAAWLNVNYKGQPGEYFRLSTPEAYANADILLRQTAARPIAARHTHRCPFRNSVLALRAPCGYSIEYLLGLLNSNVVGRLYQASAVEAGQKAFPQVKLRALRRLPIPDPRQPERQTLVSRIEEIARCLEANQQDQAAFARDMAQLDQFVAELYGLEHLG